MSSNNIYKNPESWEVVKLGAFVESEKGKKPKNQANKKSKLHSLPYVDIQAFEKGIISSWTDGNGCRICHKSDLLMVWDGSRSGLVGKGMKGALSSTLVRMNFPSIENKYAFYFLQSKYQQINTCTKGSGTPHVDPDLLWNYDFPIPSLNEQRRIVAKIEELFSELDKGIEILKMLHTQLNIYRQTVLKHAFEGKLTTSGEENKGKLEPADKLLEHIKFERKTRYERQLEEWKVTVKEWEKCGKLGKKPRRPKKPRGIERSVDSMSYEIKPRWLVPDDWAWTSLLKIGDIVAGGTPSTKEPFYWADEISWISPADLTGYSAKTIKRGAKSISKIGLANSSAKVMPAGSVHFSSRAPIGHIVVSAEPLATNQGFKSLVPAPGILSDYVYYYLMVSREYARQLASGTTFLELSGKAFGNLPIPVAPTSTQHRIVAKIEKNLSQVDKALEEIDSQLARTKMLRQSILEKAFSGQLVAQNPDDEPASVLLDSIKAEEKQTAKKIRKRRMHA